MQDPSRRRQVEDDDENEGGGQPQKSKFNGLIPIVVSVVLSLIMVYFLFNPTDKASSTILDSKLSTQNETVTKQLTDLTTKMTTMQNTITNNNSQQINNALANIPTQSSVTQVQNSVNQIQSDISSLKTQINNESDLVTKNANELEVLKQQVTDLTTKVNATPTPTPTPTTTTTNSNTDLTIKLEDKGNEILVGDESYEGEIKLSITNNTTVNIPDLRLYITMLPSEDLDPNSFMDEDNPISMAGSDISMTLKRATINSYKFETAKISIPAGKTIVKYLYPSGEFSPLAYNKYYFEFDNQTYVTSLKYHTISGEASSSSGSGNIPNLLNLLSDYYIKNDITFNFEYEIHDYILTP